MSKSYDRKWKDLTAICKAAMQLAKDDPGPYGGRYVAEIGETGAFGVLQDDDPEKWRDDERVDIYAHVLPDAVHAVGRAREYLQADGSVVFPHETGGQS